MFKDNLNIKVLIVSFDGYVIASSVIFAVVVHFWMPAGITDAQELSRLTEGDSTLLAWQNWLGGTLSLCGGFAATHFGGANTNLLDGRLASVSLGFGTIARHLHNCSMAPGEGNQYDRL
jgi:hypothetical protein